MKQLARSLPILFSFLSFTQSLWAQPNTCGFELLGESVGPYTYAFSLAPGSVVRPGTHFQWEVEGVGPAQGPAPVIPFPGAGTYEVCLNYFDSVANC